MALAWEEAISLNGLKNVAGKRKYVLHSIYFISLGWYIFIGYRLLLFWTIKIILKN